MQTRKSVMAAGAAVFLLAAAAGPSSAQARSDNGPVVVKGVTVTAEKRQKPTEAPPPLEAYATPARFEQVAMSPDGSQVAYVMTLDGVRLLVTHRFADHAAQRVRITGQVSSLAWADDEHVLLTAASTALRGTCNARDEIATRINLFNKQMMSMELLSTGASDSADMAFTLGSAMHGNPCVYYGVREQSTVTSVEMEKKTGRLVGLRFGDYENRPLGTPGRVALKGEPALAGPFLEMRDYSPISWVGPPEPAQRVFLWSVDPKTTRGRLINDGGGDLGRESAYVDDWLLDPQGGFVARSLYNFRNGRFVIQLKRDGAWKPVLTRPIVDKDHTFAPFLIGLGRREGSVVILDETPSAGGAERRTAHYYELAPDGTLSGPLEPDDAARDRPIFSPGTDRLAGFARKSVEETYALDDPDLKTLYQHAQDAMSGETVRVVSTAHDPRRMIIHADGGEDPGSYYFVDFGAGTSAPLGEDYPQIPSAWLAAQSRIAYTASDGLEIGAILTTPPGAAQVQNLPLVVLPHDGPQAHDELGFDWLAQALASRGYLVLQPQYRGSDGSGQAFIEAGYGQLGRKMQSDLADGVRFLVSQGLADPKRVCVVGAGVGGYAALMGATDAGTYRCAASINGVSDPKAYEAALRRELVRPEQDQITTLVADLKRPRDFDANPASPGILASYMGSEPPVPVKLAAGVAAPVLLVHETSDKTAPVQQSRDMRDALLAAGKPVELVEVTGPSDHALATRDARLAVLEAVLGFLAKNDPAG